MSVTYSKGGYKLTNYGQTWNIPCMRRALRALADGIV